MTDHEQPAAGVALKPLYDRLGYLHDREGLARMRESLLAISDWHLSAPINCNSLARLLDTIEALRAPTDAGGAVSEADDQVSHLARTLDKSPDEIRRALANLEAKGLIKAPQPLQQGGEVTREVEVIVSEAIFEHRDNPTMCAADVSERATKRILALFASPDLGDLVGLVERLEIMACLAAGADQPERAELLHEAARALRSLAADRDKAVGLLRRLEDERKREDARLCHLKRAVAVAWSEILSRQKEES